MTDPLPFAGRRVLVAGGSRGIGFAIADAFAQSGAALSICARGASVLDDAADALAARGGPVHRAACDLADSQAIDDWVASAAHALGGIDIVVNNGSSMSEGSGEEAWRAALDVDLMAAVRCNRAALPHLRASDAAAILHVGSSSAFRPSPRTAAYATAKAAINYYTTTLAAELGRERIRVNAIAPGSIEFPGGVWARRAVSDPDLYARTRDAIPFGGFGTVEDIASAALFLCGAQARWITGQVLAIDGGQSLRT